MPEYICVTCGTQYPASDQPPAHCPICEDDRQYVNPNGQAWTTLAEIRQSSHNVFESVEPGLDRVKSDPRVGIGQYAHLVQTPHGNVMWDCISLIDDETIKAVNALGGISAIAISHPHFHSSLVEWSRAFNNIPVYIHAGNREWVMRPDPCIRFWEGSTQILNEDITLVHCGGHFPGSSVLHWRQGADGRGLLLTSDTIDVVQDQRFVTFMYSYPNLIPLPASKVRAIVAAVEPFAFERIYESFGGVTHDAKNRLHISADRYIKAISD